MPTYAIGDVQGCFAALLRLLNKIHFDPKTDVLWFTGDLINRGPQSLETLRFIKSLGDKAITVLGNHDFALLAVGFGVIPYQAHHHTFSDILQASDRDELLEWLRQKPLVHYDATLNYTLVHAGFHPLWDLPLALSLAQEVETVLQGSHYTDFFAHLYGDTPELWNAQLVGWDRLRFIVNCFTRLRFCTPAGRVEFGAKGDPEFAPAGYYPWFAIPDRLSESLNIIFGHWASLAGRTNVSNVFALDTGCVWGNALTAMRLEDAVKITESCQLLTNN